MLLFIQLICLRTILCLAELFFACCDLKGKIKMFQLVPLKLDRLLQKKTFCILTLIKTYQMSSFIVKQSLQMIVGRKG